MDNYFPGGASQFAGGGFMPSPAPGNDNMYGDKQKKIGTGNRAETIRAVTIRQVLTEAQMADDDTFMLDNASLTLISVVGRIIEVKDTSTRITYKVHDSTGVLDMHMHTSDEADDAFMARKRELVKDVYVRVYGPLRRFNNELSVNAYSIKPILDHNEIAFHNLQVIFQSLYLQRGPPTAHAPAAGPAAGYGAPQFGTPAPQVAAATRPGMGAPSGMPAMRTGDPQTDILNVFRAQINRGTTGITCVQAEEQLRQQGMHYSLQQIKSTVEFLVNEGHLFTTIDEQHFGACDQ